MTNCLITLRQEQDFCTDGDENQIINFEFLNNGCGFFYKFYTKGWALNPDDELFDNICKKMDKVCNVLSEIDDLLYEDYCKNNPDMEG